MSKLTVVKILRTFPNPTDEAELAEQLVRPWCALAGAPEHVWAATEDREEAAAAHASALELAIVAQAKHFISQPMVQHLVAEIHSGRLTYEPISFKTGEVRVYPYNPYRTGWLDYGRLRVPRWRHWIEFGTFATLIGLFVATLVFRNLSHATTLEFIFVIFASGFILDEFAAAKEVGWRVYLANAWNAFDLSFMAIFISYIVLRVIGLVTRNRDTADLAFDILACGACVLFPRLVFFLIKNNVVVLALRGMIVTFVGFMALTAVAFTGVVFTLWRLGRPEWTVRRIVWLMLQIWFGSSSLSFQESKTFHPFFGPVILISYAALCSTLLITMMISILSNQFAAIQENAQQELLYQRAVTTLEGVRADAVFSYVPPFNIPALLILVPLNTFPSETLSKINSALVKITNFPILVAISAYERYRFRKMRRAIRLSERLGIHTSQRGFSFLGGGADAIHAAFDLAPPVLPISPRDEEQGGKDKGKVASRDRRESFLSTRSARPGADTLKRVLGNSQAQVSSEEWVAMRASQKRIEEMLEKMLAVSGEST